MPPAMSLGSPVPKRVIAWKVLIMPVTVPSSPIRGATTAMIFKKSSPRLSFGASLMIASPILSSRVSRSVSWYFSATLRTLPSELLSSALAFLSWLRTLRPSMTEHGEAFKGDEQRQPAEGDDEIADQPALRDPFLEVGRLNQQTEDRAS